MMDMYALLMGGSGGGGGSDSSVLVVNCDSSTMTLDKTWAEINSADVAVIEIVIPDGTAKTLFYVTGVMIGGEQYIVSAFTVNPATGEMEAYLFIASAEDGYPVMQGG